MLVASRTRIPIGVLSSSAVDVSFSFSPLILLKKSIVQIFGLEYGTKQEQIRYNREGEESEYFYLQHRQVMSTQVEKLGNIVIGSIFPNKIF